MTSYEPSPKVPHFNRIIRGLGNGVLNIVNNATVRVHVRREQLEVVERVIAPDEVARQVERLQQLRLRFVGRGDELDAPSAITAELIDTAASVVKTDLVNPEAAIDRLAGQFKEALAVGLIGLEGEIGALRDNIAAISRNGVAVSEYGKLKGLDEKIDGLRDHLDRQKANLADFTAQADRLLAALLDINGEPAGGDVVHVADILSWPEINHLSAAGAYGFILNDARLGPINHPFLFAHNNEIPLVVIREPLQQIALGCHVSIDSRTGEVIVNPSDGTIGALETRQHMYRYLARIFKGQSNRHLTLDGQPLPGLQANIKDRFDINRLKASEVGLFRTEGLYDEGRCRVQTLVRHFKKVIAKASTVNIRLFDLADDKMPPFIASEFNGRERGVSFLLWTEIGRSLLVDQLKAALIAVERLQSEGPAALQGKKVRLIIPMVSDPIEVQEIRQVIGQVEQDLITRELISRPVSPRLELGAMIETREAVARIDQIAAAVDYFSLGGNDLTMALLGFNDRSKLMTGPQYDWLAPAMLNGIKRVVAAAKARHLEVGSCGEISRDPLAAIILTLMGVEALSMDESYRPEINYVLTNIHRGEWAKFGALEKLLTMTDALEVRQYIFDLVHNRTHADTRVALELLIDSARPLTYQEAETT